MSKKLANYNINYILQQLIAFTFICITSFITFFIDDDIKFLKIGIQTLTILVVVIYEVIIYLTYVKARRNYLKNQNIKKSHNEHYLWFEILSLIDVLIIVALVSQVTKSINIAIHITIGFVVYYFISVLIRPYFGINHKK